LGKEKEGKRREKKEKEEQMSEEFCFLGSAKGPVS